ncbi:MAG: hypothetical protein ACYC0Y_28175 [Pirellulales bacterium]
MMRPHPQHLPTIADCLGLASAGCLVSATWWTAPQLGLALAGVILGSLAVLLEHARRRAAKPPARKRGPHAR